MENLFTKIHLQPFAVVNGRSSDAPTAESTPSQQLLGTAGAFWVKAGDSSTVPVNVVSRPENQIVRMTFSSVPFVSHSAITHEYRELGKALAEMTQLEEDDEWKIDAVVYQVACHVAAELL